MNRKLLWTSIGAALIALGITAAWAQAQEWHRWHGHSGSPWSGYVWFHHGPFGCAMHELNLSEQQRSQIKSLWDTVRPDIAFLLHEVASEQREMDAASMNGAADEAKVQEIAAREGATVARLLVAKQQLISKIYTTVLTPEQRTKADELTKRWSSHLDRLADRLGNAETKK